MERREAGCKDSMFAHLIFSLSLCVDFNESICPESKHVGL